MYRLHEMYMQDMYEDIIANGGADSFEHQRAHELKYLKTVAEADLIDVEILEEEVDDGCLCLKVAVNGTELHLNHYDFDVAYKFKHWQKHKSDIIRYIAESVAAEEAYS